MHLRYILSVFFLVIGYESYALNNDPQPDATDARVQRVLTIFQNVLPKNFPEEIKEGTAEEVYAQLQECYHARTPESSFSGVSATIHSSLERARNSLLESMPWLSTQTLHDPSWIKMTEEFIYKLGLIDADEERSDLDIRSLGRKKYPEILGKFRLISELYQRSSFFLGMGTSLDTFFQKSEKISARESEESAEKAEI